MKPLVGWEVSGPPYPNRWEGSIFREHSLSAAGGSLTHAKWGVHLSLKVESSVRRGRDGQAGTMEMETRQRVVE
jgi:hypothetical protein